MSRGTSFCLSSEWANVGNSRVLHCLVALAYLCDDVQMLPECARCSQVVSQPSTHETTGDVVVQVWKVCCCSRDPVQVLA